MEQQKNRNVYLTPNTSCLASSTTPQKQKAISYLATHVLISFLFTICVLLTLPLSAHASVITKPANNLGLVGYWNFDEGTSTYAGDYSANNNKGILTNMANPPTAGSGWGNGKFGGGMNFDGVNDYVNVGSSINIANSSFSISAWARKTSNGTSDWIFAHGTDALNNGLHFGFRSTNVFTFAFFTNDLDTIATYTDSNWHFWTATYNATSNLRKIYRDGVEVASDTASADFQGSGLAYIGERPFSTSGAFPGSIDDVRIYNRALSATEVSALYRSGSARFASSQTLTQGTTLANGLVGHWTFDGSKTTNTTALDSSGQNNTGTFTNFTRATNAKPGKLGQGMNFDGTDDYVTIPDSNAIDFSTNSDFTVSTWVKIPTTQGDTAYGDNDIVEKWSGTSGYPYVIRIMNQTHADNGRILAVQWDGSVGSIIMSSTRINDNRFHHVLFKKEGATFYLFIDSILEGSVADTSTDVTTNTSPLFLGMRGNIQNRFTGLIDDVRIYNRALSANEVKQLYNLGSAKAQASSVTLQQGTTLGSGIVGHWTFDGNKTTNTTALDSSGQNNTGTFTNFTRATNAKAGKLGQGMSFDGTDDYALVTSTAALRPTNNFTISVWAKFTDFSDYRIILMHDDNGGGDDGYGIRGDTNRKATFFATNANGFTAQSITSVAVMTAGQWYHLTGVYRNSVLEIYINGVLDSTKTASGDVVYSVTTNLNIGRRGGTSSPNTIFMKGALDDLRVYNRALSASEVKQLYLMGK